MLSGVTDSEINVGPHGLLPVYGPYLSLTASHRPVPIARTALPPRPASKPIPELKKPLVPGFLPVQNRPVCASKISDMRCYRRVLVAIFMDLRNALELDHSVPLAAARVLD